MVKIVATGMTNAEIAERLFISERTVENHVSRAMLKVGVTSRTAPGVWQGDPARQSLTVPFPGRSSCAIRPVAGA
ncbi:helix-turn-helix domain-containing protein [Arthrobacter sp. TB 23]|uniref:helix-turn-helix domain-containing protein n=1 Tax=Arthrobacter sp. TB 23 TaxID=494419 RepID=UPI000A01181A